MRTTTLATAKLTGRGIHELENIERTQFVVLTGHLDDQPLPDLIRQLRVQRKSGRLQVEYPDAPGSFFFEDGQLVDARLGSLGGLEALYAALALQGASFNFNPLVRPPERSIDRQQQKFIADLVEAPRRENLAEIKLAGGNFTPTSAIAGATQPAPLQLAPVPAEMIAPLEERLTAVEKAIHATSRRFSRERLIYAIVISFLVGLTAVTALQALLNLPGPLATVADATRANRKAEGGAAVADVNGANGEAARPASDAAPVKEAGTGGATPASDRASGGNSETAKAAKNAAPAAVASASPSSRSIQAAREARKSNVNAAAPATRDAYVVRVLMEVKNGQVTDARVLNPRPGAGAYEALALRMARQRRYPEKFSGGDTLRISVKP